MVMIFFHDNKITEQKFLKLLQISRSNVEEVIVGMGRSRPFLPRMNDQQATSNLLELFEYTNCVHMIAL